MKIILIGGGKTIYFLAKHFISEGQHVTIINRDPEESETLSHQLDATVLLGDGSNPEILEQAGAGSADVLLCLTSHDHNNLVACQIASEDFDVPRTIALVNNPENEEIFRKLGVPLIFSSTRIITSLLEEQTDFMAITNLMAVAQGKVNVTELRLPENAPVAGKSLQELKLPEGFLLATIIRNSEVLVPRGSTVLQAHDQLILIGQAENYRHVLRILTGE
jgi:trk system potassium uptake protein TrkA